jgi:hypothetical protein
MQLNASRRSQANTQLLRGIRRRWRGLDDARHGRVWPPLHWQIIVLIFFREEPARAHVHVISVGIQRLNNVARGNEVEGGGYVLPGTSPSIWTTV